MSCEGYLAAKGPLIRLKKGKQWCKDKTHPRTHQDKMMQLRLTYCKIWWYLSVLQINNSCLLMQVCLLFYPAMADCFPEFSQWFDPDPCQERLQHLTSICRGSMFFSVILRPWWVFQLGSNLRPPTCPVVRLNPYQLSQQPWGWWDNMDYNAIKIILGWKSKWKLVKNKTI